MQRGLLVLAMLALIVPAHAAGGNLFAQLQTVVTSYLAERQQPERITGVALHVEIRNRPAIDVFAGTDGRGQPIGPATLFQIGSNTKHFTAALVLKLESEGRLDIRQTVGHWLPQYPAWKNVTIRSLLSMTSPIPNYSETPDFVATLAKDPQHEFSYPDLVAYVYDRGLPVPSGWFYSNTNNILAAMIIEKAARMSYGEALRTMLIAPLGLRNTFYADGPYPPSVLNRLPAGIYDNEECALYQPQPCTETVWAPLVGKDVSRMNLSWAGPAGGIISDMDDLAAWIRALFALRVIPQKQLREMTSLVSTGTGRPIAQTTSGDPSAFGLDLARRYDAKLGSFWFYQGTTLGFRAIFGYWPQYGLLITTATNSQPAQGEDKLGQIVVGGAFAAVRKAGLLSRK
ncbi:MAG TPA: serine hydrolase domain-containing protein [Acetobacteraceae bacterium]|nr:serine hydrolase domain-containing protein [Acetobacteraceae bacterium]